MIRFEPVPEPEGFAAAATRGKQWLLRHPGKQRPYGYWRPFKSDLAEGFGNLCGYTAMYEPVGTLDHFVSCDENRDMAYDWANYRYAAGWVNASKGNTRSELLLDPFQVHDGWFKLILPSLQLVLTDAVPAEMADRANFALTRLHLGDDERVIRQRQAWYQMYQDGDITLVGLRSKAPLIARAVEGEAGLSSSRRR